MSTVIERPSQPWGNVTPLGYKFYPGPLFRRRFVSELWSKAKAIPTLDLRFADSKSLTDAVSGQNLIDFTRASGGTYVDSDGLLKVALADVPRFDHDPETGESLGLLIEEQRTNSIRNNTMVGAAAGTPGTLPTNWVIQGGGAGTLTQQVVGTGIQNGINYIDIKYSGTTSTTDLRIAFEPSTQITAAVGQSWTTSAYTAVVAGSLSNITSIEHSIVERNAAGGFLAESFQAVSTTSSLVRASVSRTLNNATAARINSAIKLAFSSGVAIDITLRIGLPQLEQGAFATSVIPTTSTAVTRNVDVATITGANFSSWYRQDEGTVFAEGASNTSTPGPFLVARGVNSGDRHQVSLGNGATVNNGAVQANLSVSYTAGQRKVAYGYAGNNIAFAVSTGNLFTDSVATIPTNLTYATLGRFDFGGQQSFNGHCRRLSFFDRRLPNATLEAITKP